MTIGHPQVREALHCSMIVRLQVPTAMIDLPREGMVVTGTTDPIRKRKGLRRNDVRKKEFEMKKLLASLIALALFIHRPRAGAEGQP